MSADRIALCIGCEGYEPVGRRLNYALALFMVAYGAFLIFPAASMDERQHTLLLRYGSELFWGCAIFLVGSLQLVAVRINGGGGWTPYARMATNYIASITWVAVAMGYGAVDPWGTAVANYTLISLAHVYCAVLGARDATKQAIKHYGR